MDLNQLLALFSAFDHERVDYIVLGALAMLFHGRVALTERLEIGFASEDDAIRGSESILKTFPGTTFEVCQGAYFRALPPGTPLFIDLVAASTDNAETVTLPGNGSVRVARDTMRPRVSAAGDDDRRAGYTLREHLGALQSLARAIVPSAGRPRGVRKYRSIEAAEAERERWDDLRSIRIRAERIRQ
jgi:hypothetical protein